VLGISAIVQKTRFLKPKLAVFSVFIGLLWIIFGQALLDACIEWENG